MTSTTTDQVRIDVEHLNDHFDGNKQKDALSVAVDGRRSGHNRHTSNGSDVDDKHRSRRSRRRSRSRSQSPSHRAKRATETGVIFFFFL